jgi:hypothetical protein
MPLAKAAKILGVSTKTARKWFAETKAAADVMPGNGELVWQLSHIRFAEWRGNVTDKDLPEKAEDKRRHLVDSLAYTLLDEPYFAEPSTGRGFSFEPVYKGISVLSAPAKGRESGGTCSFCLANQIT